MNIHHLIAIIAYVTVVSNSNLPNRLNMPVLKQEFF